jgi:hypothetical protein
VSPPQLATRVMKARRESVCPACRRPVRIGDQIAKTTLGWLHVQCAIGRQHDPLSEVSERPKPDSANLGDLS